MNEPEPKRGFWAFNGQTFKRLIGVVPGGLGLWVVYAVFFGEPTTGETATLTERLLILAVGPSIFRRGRIHRRIPRDRGRCSCLWHSYREAARA
jgi:hypothetical protein